jgi:hypothetical protein
MHSCAADHLKGSVFLIVGTAALGALLDEPEAQLADAHAAGGLWVHNAAQFGQLGLS